MTHNLFLAPCGGTNRRLSDKQWLDLAFAVRVRAQYSGKARGWHSYVRSEHRCINTLAGLGLVATNEHGQFAANDIAMLAFGHEVQS